MMRWSIVATAAATAWACDSSVELDFAALGCEAVPEGLLAELSEAATPHELDAFSMVRSSDYEAIWFVTAVDEFDVKATWASNWPNRGSGIFMSVDDRSFELTRFGRGGSTEANVNRFDHGWLESRKCVDLLLEGQRDQYPTGAEAL